MARRALTTIRAGLVIRAPHLSVKPMTLPLEWIGRKREPAARVVAVKAGPVDRETLAVQGRETFEDLLPIIATLAQGRKPEAGALRQTVFSQGGKSGRGTNLDEGGVALLEEVLDTGAEAHRFAGMTAPVPRVGEFGAGGGLAGEIGNEWYLR